MITSPTTTITTISSPIGGTSALSPYLHFGCISARELEARLPRGAGAAAYRRQLCWRDFYAQLIRAFPANAETEYQDRLRGKIQLERGSPHV